MTLGKFLVLALTITFVGCVEEKRRTVLLLRRPLPKLNPLLCEAKYLLVAVKQRADALSKELEEQFEEAKLLLNATINVSEKVKILRNNTLNNVMNAGLGVEIVDKMKEVAKTCAEAAAAAQKVHDKVARAKATAEGNAEKVAQQSKNSSALVDAFMENPSRTEGGPADSKVCEKVQNPFSGGLTRGKRTYCVLLHRYKPRPPFNNEWYYKQMQLTSSFYRTCYLLDTVEMNVGVAKNAFEELKEVKKRADEGDVAAEKEAAAVSKVLEEDAKRKELEAKRKAEEEAAAARAKAEAEARKAEAAAARAREAAEAAAKEAAESKKREEQEAQAALVATAEKEEAGKEKAQAKEEQREGEGATEEPKQEHGHGQKQEREREQKQKEEEGEAEAVAEVVVAAERQHSVKVADPTATQPPKNGVQRGASKALLLTLAAVALRR